MVIERVVGLIFGVDFYGMLDMFDLIDGLNIIVIERVIVLSLSLFIILIIFDFREFLNVVVIERVIRLIFGMMGSLSMYFELLNV